MAIDYASSLGKVRLLIADLDETAFILTDEHLEGYLGLNDDNFHRAAADALDAMATTDVLLSRKIRTQDLQTDGPAVAAELRKQAAQLRVKADAADDAGDGFFEIIGGRTSKPEGAEWGTW